MAVDTPRNERYVLTATCPGTRGIIAAVANFLAERGCNIMQMHEFDDRSTGRFFMRTEFETETRPRPTLLQLRNAFEATAARFDMSWGMYDSAVPHRVMILCSRQDHCLADLLYRHRTGELFMEITAVVSNHTDVERMVALHDTPFHHLPVTPETKLDQEARIRSLIDETGTELVVLARYMQVLSEAMCRSLEGRCINIHHSFLPGFKGAKPYHQAYDRGVKLIGATAHYATTDLDEGPIIEQVVERVDHTYGPNALVAAGRDSETVALARAVKLHTEQRVFINNNKTVVFR
jgi:formyltetrahydrofolate deformylase